MASAKPIVSPTFLDYDPDQHSGDTSSCSKDFDKWYLMSSIKKLLNVHTSVLERWNVIHWMTAYPLVSHTYADPKLRRLLEAAAERLKNSGEVTPDEIDPLACIEREVPSLELANVCFSVTKDFDIVPHLSSFEAVCLRLGLDPEELWSHVQYMMRQRGIQEVLEDDQLSLVKLKKEPAPKTIDMFGFNYCDHRECIVPMTQAAVRKQMERERRERDMARQKPGVSIDDYIDDILSVIVEVSANTSTANSLVEIDNVFNELGLDEAAAA